MSTSEFHQPVQAPTSVWLKPVTFDIRAVLRALAKVAAHSAVGKWGDVAIDTSELMTATGIKTEPAELAWLLVSRATLAALVDLIRETAPTLNVAAEEVELQFADSLSDALAKAAPELQPDFFRDPGASVFLPHVEVALERWLTSHGVATDTATVISARLRAHFVYHLNREWQRGDKLYAPISSAVDTPFTKATARETAWAVYRSALNRQVDEALFDEPFSLRQVYVPLRGYFIDDPQLFAKSLQQRVRRVIVGLEREIDVWLGARNRDDAIRLLSGGPGSGKSSFARIYAAKLARESTQRVLFIPLHQFDPAGDLETSVGEFVRTTAILPYNPLAPDDGDSHLLVIFDGLDELALQGKLAGDVAVAFVREIQRQVALRNHTTARLQVLITGRELVVQTHATEFRKRGAILQVLPYYVPAPEDAASRETEDIDAAGLLQQDQRDEWWRKYGAVSGRSYSD